MKSTNTVKTTSRFKRTVAASLAAVMMMTTAATISASADTQAAVSMNTNSAQTRIVREQYLGHDITPGSFTRKGTTINFKYSDGFFETDPKMYNPHMATTSAAMTKASVNYATSKGNYSNAADCEWCRSENGLRLPWSLPDKHHAEHLHSRFSGAAHEGDGRSCGNDRFQTKCSIG